MYLGVVLIVRKELVNWLWHVMIALLLLPVLLLIILMTKLIRNMNIFFMHIIYSKSQKILALLAIFFFGKNVVIYLHTVHSVKMLS